MHPDGITEAVHAAVPEMLDHFLRADDPVAVKQKIFQKCAFFPGESQRRAIYTGFSCTCVKGNAAASQADILLDKFASGKAADAGFQLFEMKWLGEVIVGSQIQPLYLILDHIGNNQSMYMYRNRIVVICFQISIFEPLETTEYMLQTNYQLVTHIFRN